MSNPNLKEQTQELTYLSKTNISQTLLLYKEAQSYLQQQYAKELFEQPTKEDFLETTNAAYYENYIVNQFANVLQNFSSSIDKAIALFHKMQQTFNFCDIYDAIENNFTFYLLSLNVDAETATNPKAKNELQKHYKEVKLCYREIISFINNNKI